MDTLTNIALGWYEFAKARPYIQRLMEKRLSICDTCPYKVQMNGIGKVLVKMVNNKANTFKCGKCGCPLSTLTANPTSKCKDNRWSVAGEDSYY